MVFFFLLTVQAEQKTYGNIIYILNNKCVILPLLSPPKNSDRKTKTNKKQMSMYIKHSEMHKVPVNITLCYV